MLSLLHFVTHSCHLFFLSPETQYKQDAFTTGSQTPWHWSCGRALKLGRASRGLVSEQGGWRGSRKEKRYVCDQGRLRGNSNIENQVFLLTSQEKDKFNALVLLLVRAT